MKIEKSNNPAALGALVLVLLLIVGRIGWMLFGHSDTADASSATAVLSVAPSPVVSSVVSSVVSRPAAAAALPIRSARNPFIRDAGSEAVLPRPGRAPESPEIPPVAAAPIIPLPPLPIRVFSTPAAGQVKPPAPSVPMVAGTPDKPGGPTALKLTAIVGGDQPMAIVQTARPEPVILHVGDSFENMRVAAINGQDVVFARGAGFWTLPLQSAGDEAAADPVSVAASAPEENSDELH